MRPLTVIAVKKAAGTHEQHGSDWYESNLALLKQRHHSRCIFNRGDLIDNLTLRFNDDGTLCGCFSCSSTHEGYDTMAHGGIIAAIIDSAMTQCLMGHGVAAYTARLDIRYRLPIKLCLQNDLATRITEVSLGKLYRLDAQIMQGSQKCVTAKATFCRIDEK